MLRKATSLTLCLSFIILCISSVLLFIAPEGRVAYWSNWTSLSLSKAQWGDIHITGGFLFLGACVLHAGINIRPMIAYLKIRSGKTALPVLIAMLLCAFVYVGTLAEWRPLSDVITLNDSIREKQAKKHGEPPFGHAELSNLADFCRFLRLDSETVVAGLSGKGLQGEISGSRTLKEIADANGLAPNKLYRMILEISNLTDDEIRSRATSRRNKGEKRKLPAEYDNGI